MATQTHTTAGQLVLAGAARPAAGPGCATLAAAPAAPALRAMYGHHQSAKWTVGAIAETTTFVVFDRKNRPSQRLSELSP